MNNEGKSMKYFYTDFSTLCKNNISLWVTVKPKLRKREQK